MRSTGSVAVLLLIRIALVRSEERYNVSCEDTISTEDCAFMKEYDWCEDDIDFLQRKCDYTCGWCSENDDECTDRALYLDCSKVTPQRCLKYAQFYSTRCRKSCNWCGGVPRGIWKEWSAWSECSHSCGEGVRMRSRHCLAEGCKGDSADIEKCKIKDCATWGDWSAWGACDSTCGKGSQNRTRICSADGKCPGNADESKDCNLHPLQAKGVKFCVWSACSRSCGGGTRSKVSYCPLPDPKKCPTTYEDCNTHKCPYKKCIEYRYRSDESACCADIGDGCQNRASRRVIGGTIAKPKQFAWMARLEAVGGRPGTRFRRLFCGGSLIHPLFILTAAHCFDNITPDRIQVLLGAISRDDTSTLTQRKSVAAITKHPHYSDLTSLNDIALLRLVSAATTTDFVRPVCLPKGEDTKIDTSCFVAGWGFTRAHVPLSSPNLMEAKVRHLPFGVCLKGHKSSPFGPSMNSSSMLCAGMIAGGVDTCRGDSGGPIMCQRCSSCEWYVAGVTSFGAINCGIANVPAVYTRVIHYEDWINEVVKVHDPLGVVCNQI